MKCAHIVFVVVAIVGGFLAERFSNDERALLMRVIGFPNTVSDESACWLIKTVFAEIKELPVKERHAVSRLLVQSANP